MSLFSWMSRPAWQSRDTAKRTQAVANSREAALLAELPQILRNDPEASVRRAALERIDDLTVVADRMSNDGDAGIRERARARLIDLLAGSAPIAERRRALGLVEEQTLLEQIAKRAPEVEMRRAALERCKRVGFIAERVLDDADADLRIELLARIDHVPTLERLAQQARTKDKRLFRAIRERLDAGKLAAGESDALIARAEAICISVEQQLRHPGSSAATVLASAHSEWLTLRPRIDDRLDRRFDGAVATLNAAVGAIARIGEVPVVVEPAPLTEPASTELLPVAADIVPAAPAEPPSEDADAALSELLRRADEMTEDAAAFELDALERRWQSNWSTASQRNAADQALAARFEARLATLRSAAHSRSEAHLSLKKSAEAAIAAVDTAIESGQLLAARAARAQARSMVDALPAELTRALSRQLSALDPRIDKLAQWQRWSDNKVRVRLCEEAEGLLGSGMHPDGLANKVTELKQAWKRIDDSEIDPAAPAAESGLSRRFRFLCHKALEPARGYFEKRKEVRGRRSEELGAFIERARSELDVAGIDFNALITLKREAGENLRRVDEVDPRQRGEIGKQLKQLIETCSATIDARFAAIADEKQKFIAQLRRQLTHAELDAALDLAKSAQKRWQSLGKGSQKSDQALWQEFRAVIDPLFAQRNDALKAADAERDAGRAAAQALIDELRALPEGNAGATQIEAEIERIETAWRSDAERPRDLERALDDAVAKAHAAAAGRRHGEQAARQDRINELASRLDGIESRWCSGEDVASELDEIAVALKALEPGLVNAIAARGARLRAANGDAAITAEQLGMGERLALEYEYLAGVESPAVAQTARMNLQVERLAARMSTGHSLEPREQRLALDLRWWALGPLTPDDRERLAARRARALAALK